mmetsp:Transcript_13416/g.20983  ORF Transcript_13416/g.20983 Transcript_13416/m.20983 type:complete len:109 (+) Transcript_13416:90-416(+)
MQQKKRKEKIEEEESSESDSDSFEEMDKFTFVEVERKDKWTISPNNPYYRIWEKWIVIVCVYTTLAYPYYTANDFPLANSWGIFMLIFFECCFLIQMFLKFFLQEIDE